MCAALVAAAVALGPGTATAQSDNLALADSLNQQVVTLITQGRYGDAVPLALRALAIREKALRPDHPLVGVSLSNLALLYDSQGRYDEAEPLFKRSLAIYEKAFGPDAEPVGLALNNLAELYRKQGRYAEAEPLYAIGRPYRRSKRSRRHDHLANDYGGQTPLELGRRRHL
jgi:tetratricopeptide (TPR) repeat protein